MKFESTLDGVIACLEEIKKYTNTGDIPVNINLIADRQVALKNIYFDNDSGSELSVYFEGDYEDRAESSKEFFLLSSVELQEKEEQEKQRLKELTVEEPIIYHSFIDDIDKMYDIMDSDMSEKEFLTCYSYLNEEEYNLTIDDILPLKDEYELSDHNQCVVENVAYLMRRAENMHIEDINGRPNGWSVMGEDMKWRVTDWVTEHFTDAQVELFRELCNAMGV